MNLRRTTDLFLGTALVLLLAAPAFAVTNGGFETADFTDWSTSGDTQVVGSEVGGSPTEGSFQAMLATTADLDDSDGFNISGSDAELVDALETVLNVTGGTLDSLTLSEPVLEGSAVMTTTFAADAGDTVTFDWNFLTDEPVPATTANDLAFAIVDDHLFLLADTTATFAGTSNTELLDETGYTVFSHELTTSGNHTLSMGVVDVSDRVGASALLIDNVVLTAAPAAPGDLDGDGDVDRDDLNILLSARNQPAVGPNDPGDLDGDGIITALDARILVTVCTLPRCAVGP